MPTKGRPRLGHRYLKPKNGNKRGAEYTSQVSFYCRPALEAAIEKQAEAQLDSKSAIMSGILQVALLSPVGKRLQSNAAKKGIPFRQELQQVLNSFQSGVPLEKIEQLASSSQRTPEQMTTYLLLLGLEEYEKNPRG